MHGYISNWNYGDVCKVQMDGQTVAVYSNDYPLMCLPNKIPEVCKKKREREKEVHIWSSKHLELGWKSWGY